MLSCSFMLSRDAQHIWNQAGHICNRSSQLKPQYCLLGWPSRIIQDWTKATDSIYRGGVAQWVARLTRNRSFVCKNPITGFRRFIKQLTLPSLLSTGWFQERIRALFHTRIKMNSSKGLIEYWYSCEIITLVKYRKWIWDDASTCTCQSTSSYFAKKMSQF